MAGIRGKPQPPPSIPSGLEPQHQVHLTAPKAKSISQAAVPPEEVGASPRDRGKRGAADLEQELDTEAGCRGSA